MADDIPSKVADEMAPEIVMKLLGKLSGTDMELSTFCDIVYAMCDIAKFSAALAFRMNLDQQFDTENEL